MAKTVGLSRADKKMLEFLPFKKDLNPAGLLYNQSKNFYSTFRTAFGNGYKTILGHDIPNLELLGPCIVNYHFSIELMLKSLIYLKGTNPKKTHNLIKLLKSTISFYPELTTIYKNSEYRLLLIEISKIGIRYAEGSLTIRHNNKDNWQEKKPFQELSEAMEIIFTILKNTFDKSKLEFNSSREPISFNTSNKRKLSFFSWVKNIKSKFFQSIYKII